MDSRMLGVFLELISAEMTFKLRMCFSLYISGGYSFTILIGIITIHPDWLKQNIFVLTSSLLLLYIILVYYICILYLYTIFVYYLWWKTNRVLQKKPKKMKLYCCWTRDNIFQQQQVLLLLLTVPMYAMLSTHIISCWLYQGSPQPPSRP